MGNSSFEAGCRAVFLGVIAGVPIPVFFTIGFMVIGLVNRILPKTKGVEVKLPTLDHQNLGKFISDFKIVEELLQQAVEKIDPSKVSSKVSENIKFLQDRGMIPENLVEPLDKIRKTRNSFVHPTPEMPSLNDLRELKKVKDEVETIFKR